LIVTQDAELQQLKIIGRIVAMALRDMVSMARPGITTRELDQIGAAVLAAHGARSAPVLVYDFPGATCISVNEEVAHGIPGDRVLQPGDIINIDVSAERDGYYADTGASLVLAPANPHLLKLCRVSQSALQQAVAAAKAGSKLNRIGKAIEREAGKNGFTVIRNLYSHGIGRNLHEEPACIPGFYDPGTTELMALGTVMALEAFVSAGADHVTDTEDGWTLKTPDGSFVAQFEHTVVVTKDKPVILTQL
jgi:methionyl aminopeptidase